MEECQRSTAYVPHETTISGLLLCRNTAQMAMTGATLKAKHGRHIKKANRTVAAATSYCTRDKHLSSVGQRTTKSDRRKRHFIKAASTRVSLTKGVSLEKQVKRTTAFASPLAPNDTSGRRYKSNVRLFHTSAFVWEKY